MEGPPPFPRLMHTQGRSHTEWGNVMTETIMSLDYAIIMYHFLSLLLQGYASNIKRVFLCQ